MENILAEDRFGTGGLGHTIQPTDWVYENLIPRVPQPFNWDIGYNVQAQIREITNLSDIFTIPIKNQGVSSACGGMAGAYYAAVLDAFKTKSFTDKSAKYIYAPIAKPGGGSWGGDIMKRIKSKGAAAEILCPSSEGINPPSEEFITRVSDITEEATINASFSESISYAFMYNFDIDALAQAIRDSKGLIILIRGSNNGTWLSPHPLPPSPSIPEKLIWGHWIYLGKASLIEGKKMLGGPNSWGDSIGDRGWQWFGEDYINSGRIELAVTMQFGLPKAYQFTKDLYMSMTDADVLFLQKVLNKSTITEVAVVGPGSPGHETYYFGQRTKNAVIRYQLANGIAPPLGFVGPKTRTMLNNLVV